MEELVWVFDEFLSVINVVLDMRRGEEDLMEVGFFFCLGLRLNMWEDGFWRKEEDLESDEELVESFQDVVEKLEVIVVVEVDQMSKDRIIKCVVVCVYCGLL